MEVEIRSPFPFEALPRIWRWIEPFREKVSDDFSPQTLGAFVGVMEQKWGVKGHKSWAVYGDGELGGLITYEELTPWVGTAHFLLKPDFQRRGLSVKAARLAAGEIFDRERIGKLVFYPLAGNLAIGSLLINLGAKREGTLAGQTLAGGKPIDMWVYGLTREGFKQHANGTHRSGNRGSQLDPGLSPIRPAQDADIDHHTDSHAADAADHGRAVELRQPVDDRSECGAGAD